MRMIPPKRRRCSARSRSRTEPDNPYCPCAVNAMKYQRFFKKTAALLIGFMMLFGCVSCAGGKNAEPFTNSPDGGGKNAELSTNQPANESSAHTQTPSASPHIEAPTEEPAEPELVFENLLDAEITGLFISSIESDEWGEPVSNSVKSKAGETIPFSAFRGIEGELYDIGTIDEKGVNYDGYDIMLLDGDRIVLSGSAESAVFTVYRQDGTSETVAADVYSDEPGEGKRSGYLYPNVISCSDYAADSETNRLYASLSCSSVTLNAADAERFPALDKALNALAERRAEDAASAYRELLSDAPESFQSTEPEAFEPVEFADEVYIRRSEENLLSMLFLRRVKLGDSVSETYACASFDPESGALLMLSDVFEDVQSLQTHICEALEKRYGAFPFDEDTDLISEFTQPSEKLFWTLDPEGLSVVILGASFGGEEETYTVFLPYGEYEADFKARYLPKVDNYACAFSLDFDQPVAEGNNSMIRVSADLLEDQTLHISYNGAEFREELNDIYEVEPYFIHANGRDLLYLDALSDNDCRILLAYSFEGGSVVPIGYFSGAWRSSDDASLVGDYSRMVTPIVDPESFALSSQTEIMGTAYGSRNYRIGGDGMPESEDKYYIIDSEDIEFTLKQPLELHYVTEEGDMDVSTILLDAGSTLVYFRTDGERFADLELENGQFVRAVIDGGCIDSVPIGEIFDGIVFAG